jgi:predicted amino acid-binding ACT domain protein
MLKNREIEIEGWVDYAQKLFNNEIQIKIISQKNFRQTYFTIAMVVKINNIVTINLTLFKS